MLKVSAGGKLKAGCKTSVGKTNVMCGDRSKATLTIQVFRLMEVGGILLFGLAQQNMIGTHSDVQVNLWVAPLQEIDAMFGDRSKMASTIQVFRLIGVRTV